MIWFHAVPCPEASPGRDRRPLHGCRRSRGLWFKVATRHAAVSSVKQNMAEAGFEQGVLCHVLGSLLAWALGLLGYMLFLLWKDYISLIVSAFLLSQALHTPRAVLVEWAERLREQTGQPLYKRFFTAFTTPTGLISKLTSIPSLVQLSLLLVLDLLDDVTPLITIAYSVACALLLFAAIVYLLDRKVLAWSGWISDEVLAATAVLLTFLFVVMFVTTVIAVRSVLDLRELAVSAGEVMGGIAPAASGAFSELAESGLELSKSAMSYLDGPEHKWASVALHLLSQLQSASNGTAVVESTFLKVPLRAVTRRYAPSMIVRDTVPLLYPYRFGMPARYTRFRFERPTRCIRHIVAVTPVTDSRGLPGCRVAQRRGFWQVGAVGERRSHHVRRVVGRQQHAYPLGRQTRLGQCAAARQGRAPRRNGRAADPLAPAAASRLRGGATVVGR